MKSLADSSSIITFECDGDTPSVYQLTFHGKGLRPDTDLDEDVAELELHRIEIRLPSGFPTQPPDIRWQTPVFHPNIAFSGFVNLRELEMPWSAAMSLDIVCERLWDVVRWAYVNTDRASNYTAQTWLEDVCERPLPLDERPLRDDSRIESQNVIKYRRKSQLDSSGARPAVRGEIFYIGEDVESSESGHFLEDVEIRSTDVRPMEIDADETDDGIFFIDDGS